jgi:hypothetical protein
MVASATVAVAPSAERVIFFETIVVSPFRVVKLEFKVEACH